MVRLSIACCAVLALLALQGCATTAGPSAPAASGRGADHPAAPGSAEASAPPRETPRPSARADTVPPDEACIIEEDEAEGAPLPPGGKEPAIARALYFCRLAQAQWKRGDLEAAMDILDRAYALVLSVEPGNDPDLLQEKDDLRLTISRRILEIYSSRHLVVNGKRNEIPLTINRHVQDEIDSFTIGRERDFFVEAYRRSGRHRPRIEAALKDAGLPAELAWLPLIESGYKVTALSSARALGLWQFIPSTGYRYNLNRDKYVDERMDPEKATRGAIDYLKELHGMFGDWSTVLAAYNCGENRVLRTIQAQNINYLDNFWDLYERLPRETARYVPRFIATLHVVQNLEKYGLADIAVDPPSVYRTVTIPHQCSLKSIAQATGIDPLVLQELNAELRQGILPEEGYELRVPPGEADGIVARIAEIPVYREPPRVVTVVLHKVQKGDTVDSLARKYGSDERSILAANNMRRVGPLTVGATLRVPQTCPPGTAPTAPAAAAKGAAPSKPTEHTVRKGETLAEVARQHGTTPQDLQKLNGLKSPTLRAGQILRIPPPPTAKAEPPRTAGKAAGSTPTSEPLPARLEPGKPRPETTKPKTGTYAVRSGDTLYSIARRHHMTLERLLALNRLNEHSRLQQGQTLVVDN